MSVQDPWVLGIDFGTSFTVAAARTRRGPEVIEIGGERRVPSVVLAEDDGSLVVGRSAENLATSSPGRAIRAPKTRIGEPAPVILGGRTHDVTTLIASLLSYVYQEAVRQMGSPPSEVRLTHPAAWSRVRLDRLLQAAAGAQLPNPVLVPEPVAAAVSFADEIGVVPGGFVAVYDLGGGTFDTAVLQATVNQDAPGFVVIGRPGGEDRLGGDLFDELLTNFVGSRLNEEVWEALQVSDDRAWQQAASALRSEARRVKEALSSHPYAELLVALPNGMVTQRVTRDEFEALIEPYIATSVDVLRRAVSDAGLEPLQLSAVYLAGGASRSPLVERMVQEAFPGVNVSRRGDPKTAVALGATHGRSVLSSGASWDRTQPAGSGGGWPGAIPMPGQGGPPGSNPPGSNPPGSNPPAWGGPGAGNTAGPGPWNPAAAGWAGAPAAAPTWSAPGGGQSGGFAPTGSGPYPPATPSSSPQPSSASPPPPPSADQRSWSGPAGHGPPPGGPGPAGGASGPGVFGGPGANAPGHPPTAFAGSPGGFGAPIGQGPPSGYGSGHIHPPPQPKGPGKGLVGALIGGLAVVVMLLGLIVLLSRGDSTESGSGTTRGPSERPNRQSTVTSLLPSTVPLSGATTLPPVTTGGKGPGPVLEGAPTLAEVQSALLTGSDVGPAYQTVGYGTDEPYCGEPVVISSRQRANTAFEVAESATSGVRIDNDIQSYADAAGAAADLEAARSLANSCVFSTTVVEGVEYIVIVSPFEAPRACDDSEVFLQVAAPSTLEGPSLTRAIGFARCGRNLTAVSLAVVGREFAAGDEELFTSLFATAVGRLAVIPR
ncbi:MAG: Hsp70 family protein [Acidimicrobiales bacterium]